MAEKRFRPIEHKISAGAKIVPHLWFVHAAVGAAKFCASIFPDSRVDSVTPLPADTPSGPAGTVTVVELTLAGQPFMAISGGLLDPFHHAISFIVNCDDQSEIDRLWDALSDGGTTEMCGWLNDSYGVCSSGPGPRPACGRGDVADVRHRRARASIREHHSI